jgi:hypothetical protein
MNVRIRARDVLLAAAPAIVLVSLVLLPFRNKAFTIDDTLFLKQAQHALTDPLHPTAFEIVWSEFPFPVRVSRIMPSGPVMAWLLLPAVAAGGLEWMAHSVQLVMMAVALLATVALGLRLGLTPRWAAAAGLLLAGTPAVLGMAGTAMPDVAAMAFGVAGLERLVAWKEDRRADQGVVAAVLLGLAPLARSHLILILGIGALFLADDLPSVTTLRRIPRASWIPLVVAPIVTVALAMLTRDPAPGPAPIVGAMARFVTERRVPENVVAFTAHWVVALPLGLPWVLLRWGAMLRWWWILLAGTVTTLVITWLDWGILFSIAPIAGLGLTVLVDILFDGWTRRDRVAFALGVWLLLPISIVVYIHLPAKYLLASAPAAAILIARALESLGGRRARAILAVTLVPGLLVGVAILHTDAAFAELGRRAAAEWIAPRVAAGERVWFAGHWGFQWYAEKAGGRCLTSTPPYPAEGEHVVSSLRCLGREMQMYPRRALLERVVDDTPGGRLMSQTADAGFYSDSWGYLPWGWGDDALDEYDLWRIEQDAPTLPFESNDGK